jgi:glycosyltransferase involved in cell wall biosynthesis
MTTRKKILWLVSWYPNRNDPFDGDFIQRQARAAALYHDIHVLFVADIEMGEKEKEEVKREAGLVEQRVYFRRPEGFFGYLKKQWRWRKLFLRAAEKYIEKNGKPDWVHVHIPWKAGLIAQVLKMKHKIPYIVTEHWGRYDDRLPGNIRSRPPWEQKLVAKIFAGADAFLPVSDYLGKGVQRMVVEKEYTVVPNVVDTHLFFPAQEKGERFTFLHVSNMAPVKNVEGILKAFHEAVFEQGMKEARMLFIGNRNDEYPKMTKAMGLDEYVTFRGEMAYEEVAEEMRRCHVLVMKSDSETFSCVTAEALCCGLPVIAPRTGALPELVNESNGILFEKGKLLEAMISIKENYSRFDKKAIAQEAASRFQYNSVGEKLSSIYQKSPVVNR